ncbi:NADPH:quinone reductase [Streptomyces sp. TverLS-915]|uniref:quinone oxidoreductase family protein n=1 Tax=Streptomyces sp. TverLS-915 TaxID=1839763 RepID=UPI00081DA9C9|nr:NADP-dependent oxidoreductase [Streptomyces sp. TverLS-915]SCD34104.1 NADPH:quinone reductase [Streptomyces sp. TverLS-915]
MRAVGFTEHGGPEVLAVVELPEPEPGPGEIRVRVHGAAVNPADTLLRSLPGAMAATARPHLLGMDLAGVVDKAGPGAPFAAGDRVMSVVLPVRHAGGAYAEYVVVPAEWAVVVPAGIALHEAATVPMNALTALAAIETMQLKEGDVAGVTGAAGAFGGSFLQLAAARGIRTVADAAPQDEGPVQGLGATWTVPRGPEVAARMREAVPDGVDALLDGALLGADVLGAVRDGGAYAGLRKLGEPGTKPLPPAPRGISYRGFGVHDWFGRTDLMAEIAAALGAGRLSPRVAGIVPPEQAPRAHAALEAGGTRGRYVLDFS